MLIFIWAFGVGQLFAQTYYFRGVIKDEQQNILSHVPIIQLSTGTLFRSGELGTFEIVSTSPVDSFHFYLDGFLPLVARWESKRSQRCRVHPNETRYRWRAE